MRNEENSMLNKREVKVYSFYIVIKIVSIIMIKIIVLCLLFIYIALIGYRALGMLILTTINTSSTGIKTSKNDELKD